MGIVACSDTRMADRVSACRSERERSGCLLMSRWRMPEVISRITASRATCIGPPMRDALFDSGRDDG
jgi:hypothetical protein